jgi:hypothetical protein
MANKIHTIQVNGQTFVRKTDGYTVYAYAVPTAGRKIEVIRGELERTIAAATKNADRWIAAGFDYDNSEDLKVIKKAERKLARLADVPAGTFVWEKASWHADFELALKAARGRRDRVYSTTIN